MVFPLKKKVGPSGREVSGQALLEGGRMMKGVGSVPYEMEQSASSLNPAYGTVCQAPVAALCMT